MTGRGALAAALSAALLSGAAGCVTASPRPPASRPRRPAPVAHFRLPPHAFDGLGEGLVRTVPVEVVNAGKAPFVILGFRITGAATGHRSLTIPGGHGRLRAFGFVPPGASARYRLAFYFPTPGAGRVHLTARLRPLRPGAPGRLMEEQRIPTSGPAVPLSRTIPVRVAPRGFTRAAAEARIGGPADDAVYVRTLHAWVLKRGNGTFVVEVGDTIPFPGLSLAAAALLDEYDGAVPVVDDRGRLREVPKGPALRLLLDRARRNGLSVTVTSYSDGRRALRVGR